ncbi:MAG: primosomal protein N' [Anaerolineae bacterium]|nr:primosomal protein N' [Anaerolineae bacterium]
MFAVVSVNATIHGTRTAYRRAAPLALQSAGDLYPGPVFHYHIPVELDGKVCTGALVEVPFGPQPAQGLVIALSDRSPVPDTKPVARLLSGEPVLSERQVDLGLWLSEYYLAPLIDCLRLMLPPGLLRRPRTVFRLHPDVAVPSSLPAAQQQVIDLVGRYGALSRAQIARRLGVQPARRAVRSLTRRGILVPGSELPAPRVQPKRVNFVRLTASPPQVEAMRPSLGRPSKQAQLLQALLDDGDPLPPTDRLLEVAETSMATVHALAGRGWIEVVPRRVLVLPLPDAADVDLKHAPKQRAVLEYLRAQSMPVEELALRTQTGASTSTLRALEGKRLLRRLEEPSAVLLRLSGQETRDRVIDLRGAGRQHRVLDYLLARPAGEWVWVSWVYAETDCRLEDLRVLEGFGLVDLAEREVWRDPLLERTFVLDTPPRLTPDQERVWAEIEPALRQLGAGRGGRSFLLHGVTGSGKTEIYMRAVDATLAQGRQAIVLVPEISLTPQAIRRFAARFPKGIGVIHSGLSDGERYDTWRRIRAGHIQLVIGPRSALFAPLENIGLIVLDEEHDSSYKQSDVMPTYHTRRVAQQIAAAQGAVVLLGSATPDLSTFYHAHETGTIQLLRLPQRILRHRLDVGSTQDPQRPQEVRYRSLGPDYEDALAADLPPVRVVDMRHELRAGNRSIFSRALQQEMKRVLAEGEQTILFLNRRGASTFVMCRDCGTVIRCPRCEVALTFHLKDEQLVCHHCRYQRSVPEACPVCQSHRIKYFGLGTQRVEKAVHELLPAARVIRWDRDTARSSSSHQALLDRFTQHQADVLVGTQMIAKGLDLPLVTLVGVISADTALNLPDFRAAERTFQLLAQVSGRAGRSSRGGQAIVQTYAPEHYAIQAAAGHDYAAFYARERAFRHQLGYPPFARLARLVYSDPDPAHCRQQARDLSQLLNDAIRRGSLEQVALIGPAPCFLVRLRGRWRWQIIVRAPPLPQASSIPAGEDPLHKLLRSTALPPGWRLDVDPLDML